MKAAFTIVTANYLAQAKTLADSFVAHNEDYRFVICLLDKINGRFNAADFSPYEILAVEDLGIPYFAEMNARYDMFEMSNALKPFFAEYLCQQSAALNLLLYLDSDMMVFQSFRYIETCLEDYAICLTPHILTTIPRDGFSPDESSFLNSGIFNGGFFAIAIVDEAIRFIRWWKEKLRFYSLHDVCRGFFVDQIWLNFVPYFFDKVFVVKHAGYNMAYYNLHERYIVSENGTMKVNGKNELVLYHFTGYDITNDDEISKYQTRFRFEQRTDIKPLYNLYKDKLLQNKHPYYSTLVPLYGGVKEERLRLERRREKDGWVNIVRRLKEKITG